MIAEFTKKDILVESLSGLDFSNEPQHYLSLREEAKNRLKNLEVPTTKDEYWKYTRLGKIVNNTYSPGALESIDLTDHLIPALDANIIVLVNGYYSSELSCVEEQEGIVVLPLGVGKEKGSLLPDYFNKLAHNEELFMALNNAFHTDGVCIHATKNAVIEKPYHIVNVMTGENVIAQTRNFFWAEQSSSFKVIESFVNLGEGTNFMNNVCEFFVDDNAQLEYNKIQNAGSENFHISTEQVYQAANSNFTINTATFTGALVRNNLNIEVDASNCETNLSGLYLGKGKDHLDNHTVVDHKKPHCNSNEVYKGVLDDQSTGVFNGKVFVRQDAQITNAFQQNNNILLSDDASVNSKPELEIYADDVKCSHGSTTGQLDDEAIFYLQSRGIKKRSAVNLMINAFAKDALERVSIEPLSNYIDSKIEDRFMN